MNVYVSLTDMQPPVLWGLLETTVFLTLDKWSTVELETLL